MSRAICVSFGSLALLCLAGATTGQQPPPPMSLHHHLHHTLWELRDAHKELKESTWSFGDHKDKALSAIHDAIKQVETLIKFSPEGEKGVPTRRDLTEEYKKYKHHAHLHHAMHLLHEAHRQLKESTHAYGGHREAALKDIHEAEHQIEKILKEAKRL